MSKRKLSIYLLIPTLVSVVLLGMYFSGHIVLQRLVCPKLPPLSPDAWREFGILENLQHLILLSLFAVACAGVARKKAALERMAWAGLVACAAFLLLEEIDYGAHLKHFFFGGHQFNWFQPMAEWPPDLIAQIDLDAEPVNLHNHPGVNKLLKKAGDLLIAGWFVILPLLAMRWRNKWVQYAAPDTYAILTVAAIALLRSVTHALGDWENEVIQANLLANIAAREPGAIAKNLSEFRELNFYYLLLVYCSSIPSFVTNLELL